MHDGTLLAAVDLGSNSFRLEISRLDHGRLHRVQYLKETVRQGNGLDADGRLTDEAMRRGWDCLARFGERLAGFDRPQVRAVATQTLREAVNREVFIQRGAQLLGFPIDVISGPEEARLIYQGVAHLLLPSDERRLVIDIGGRSTELILGRQLAADTVASFPVGSVAWSQRFFPEGQFTAAAFDRAEVAAQAVLEEALEAYPRSAWDTAYGSSGTAGAVGDILTGMGGPAGLITRYGLDELRDRLIRARNADRLQLGALKEDRRPVIGGGVSVLRAVMRLLDIDQMTVAQGALRQGVIYDLLDREHPQTDLRAATVSMLGRRFGVDAAQGARVARVACALFGALLPPATAPDLRERMVRKLGWAAQLHEIGCLVSHSDSHKHGAYILDNTDAPGFALPELHRLAQLVLGQRGKLRKVEAELSDPIFLAMVVALRIAVALCHARRDPDLGGVALAPLPRGGGWALAVQPAWESTFPQSLHLLREEALCWQRTPWRLDVVSAARAALAR
ncbi:Ppx/GppA phosphatase family protein [uncultured Xylophilus sp.]|uniref:Ppx/GppA phosphatase family protein n=1 Tax=uncultured Xylophilus sp. TaxID=296832 RepID=UPI0025F7E8DF|nr:Ppx/GppA phosphatase family protein [uncultured Xylophilus sp.]